MKTTTYRVAPKRKALPSFSGWWAEVSDYGLYAIDWNALYLELEKFAVAVREDSKVVVVKTVGKDVKIDS